MSTRRLIVAAILGSLSIAAFVSAQSGAAPDQPADTQPGNAQPGNAQQPGGPAAGDRTRARRGEGQPESLESLMKVLGRGLRALKRQGDKPESRGENLQIIIDMQRAAVLAKSFKPDHLPETGQEEYLKNFRLRQIDLAGLLLKLEKELINADYAAVARTVGEIEEARNSAHKIYDPEEEKDGSPGPAPGRGNAPPRGQ